jgi:hypothetical protein
MTTRLLSVPLALLLALAPRAAAAQQDTVPTPPPIGDTITTASGLRYVFLHHGDGPRPDSGDLMVIHGVGRFTDGKVFWDTRAEGEPYEYTYKVDRVIRGFSEGMGYVRQGDRVVIVMKPDLAYGDRNRPPIPPGSTLVFDYEILGVYHESIPRMMRDGFAKDGVDATLERLRKTPDLWRWYGSESDLLSAAMRVGRTNRADGAKVLRFGLGLVPFSWRMHQALARDLAAAGDTTAAKAHWAAAARLNPRATEREVRAYEAALKAIAELGGA